MTLRYALCSLCLSLASLTAGAQLNELHFLSVEDGGSNDTGETVGRRKLPGCRFEIVPSAPVEGLAVVTTAQMAPSAFPPAPPAMAAGLGSPKNPKSRMLVVTADGFMPLTVNLEEVAPEIYPLDPSRTYRVNVAVPSVALVSANNAFEALDFDKAPGLYRKVIDSDAPEWERIVAETRHGLVPELRQMLANARRHTTSPDPVSRFKAARYWNRIYRHTRSATARAKRDSLRVLLPAKARQSSGIDPTGISRLTLDTLYTSTGAEAKTSRDVRQRPIPADALPAKDGKASGTDDSSRPYWAALIVRTPLAGATFTRTDGSAAALDTVMYRDGEYWLVIRPGAGTASARFTINHHDCAPLEFSMADHGITEVKPMITYRAEISAPSADVMAADRHFAAMEFDDAMPLYATIAADSLDTSPGRIRERREAENRALLCLAYGPWMEQYNDLREKVNRGGVEIDRRLLTARIDSILAISRRFEAAGIPAAAQIRTLNEGRLEEYRHCFHMVVNVSQIEQGTKLGNEIFVEFDAHGLNKTVLPARRIPSKDVHRHAFHLFVPREFSDRLTAGQKISFKAAAKVKENRKDLISPSVSHDFSGSTDNMNIIYNVIL